jgi:hypothetical protein
MCSLPVKPISYNEFRECYPHKPSVAHLKVFGSVAYAHPNQKHTKLDYYSKKLIFIGYDEKSKAYNFYDPLTKGYM